MRKSSIENRAAEGSGKVALVCRPEVVPRFRRFLAKSFGSLLTLLLVLPAVAVDVNYSRQGAQFAVIPALVGDQTFPQISVRPGGGYIVWQDNITDGDGLGVSARRLDGTLSGTLGVFRVNVQGTNDQEKPNVATLNNGGAIFVWQGGKQGFQNIYARFMSSNNTWATGDLLVNTFTNSHHLDPSAACLLNGNVVVVYSSVDQDGSMQGVYAQMFSPNGQKIGGEFRINQTTAYNQRTPALSRLSDGRFVVAWISEQQRFQNSVDVFARLFTATGAADGSELLVNTDTNICANPSVAGSSDGGFAVAWGQRDSVVRSNSWDIFSRIVSGAGIGSPVRIVNTRLLGDQFAPKIGAVGTDYLVVWTSLAQDGSRDGVFGQFLNGAGVSVGGEILVNTTTVSQQIHPAVASDGASRFLVGWTSFGGGANSFDLFAQRYGTVNQPLAALAAPFVSIISSNALAVSWQPVSGLNIANYEVYADGAAAATASTASPWWSMSGLSAASTHSFRVCYVLSDGRRSPLSPSTSATTYSAGATWGGIPQEWMTRYFGGDMFSWPSPNSDSDGDGASNLYEFLAGTDPTNANSVLRVQLQSSPQGLFLSWNTQAGLIYKVQTCNDFKAGNWVDIGSLRFAAGTVDSVYVGSSNTSYYRVVRVR
jgi:hypothetical protein